MKQLRLIGLAAMLLAVVGFVGVASAAYVDDFSTDTSANYTQGPFEITCTGVPTLTGDGSVLQAQATGSVPNSSRIMLTNGEMLDTGEYVEVKVSMAGGGGMHWKNIGLIVCDGPAPPTPRVNAGGPMDRNGFVFLFDPSVGNRGTTLYHVDGFAAFDSGEGVCDMAPNAANVYASGALTGDTHTLRIAKLATSLEFYVDGNLMYTYNDKPGATIAGQTWVGMHFADWQGDQSGSFDDFVVAPEPTTMGLLSAGGIVCILRRKR